MFEIVPAVDLKAGRCVRLMQGRADAETVFSDDPVAMIQAVGAVVHKNEKPEKAFQLYQQLKTRNVPDRSRLAKAS